MSGAGAGNRDQAGGSVILLLSLKLILLAFFILLNALSEFEQDRARAVIDSVNRAFRGELELARDTAEPGRGMGALPQTETLAAEVGSLFESAIPASRTKAGDQYESIRVDLPQKALFMPDSADIRPARRILIRRLARALVRDGRRMAALRLDVLYGVPGGTAMPAPGGLEVRRAGTLARRLLAEGLPPASLSAGVLPGLPGRVRFVLRAVAAEAGEEPAAAAEEAR